VVVVGVGRVVLGLAVGDVWCVVVGATAVVAVGAVVTAGTVTCGFPRELGLPDDGGFVDVDC
jgi:hypothetical protein